MPNISQISQQITEFPNLYISPYGNDGIIPLYSSVPIDNMTSGDCLPCVLCGNSVVRGKAIAQEAIKLQPTAASSTNIAVYK